MKKEANQTLPFRDVKIEHENGQFFTSISRKSTFTGQYIRWIHLDHQNAKPTLSGLEHTEHWLSVPKANFNKKWILYDLSCGEMATPK